MKKICLISGATSGIGKAAALALCQKDYSLIILGRSQAKCQSLQDEVLRLNSKCSVKYFVADLSSRADVVRLGKELHSEYEHIDVLVNNAGAIFMQKEVSVDGIEKTWALNHFGYYWLTMEILDLLKNAKKARIINVSSAAHKRIMLLNLDKAFAGQGMLGWTTYGATKLANLWFTFELERKLKSDSITVNAMHPGVVATSFAANNGMLGIPFKLLTKIAGLSPEAGAKTIVFLVDSDTVTDESGQYFVKEKSVESSKFSRNQEYAAKLWKLTEKRTKEIDQYLLQR